MNLKLWIVFAQLCVLQIVFADDSESKEASTEASESALDDLDDDKPAAGDLDDLDNDEPETGGVNADGFQMDKDVIVGQDKTFDDILKKHKKALVEFYAPWCGHCKQLAPKWEEAAAELKSKGRMTKLVKVDATVETTIAGAYSVSGYPTIKYFVDGKESSDYDGDRTTEGIISWVTAREMPAMADWTDTLGKSDDELVAKLRGEDQEDEAKRKPLGDFLILCDVVKKSVRYKACEQLGEFWRGKKGNVVVAVRTLPKGTDSKGSETKAQFFRTYALGVPEKDVVDMKVWKYEKMREKFSLLMYKSINYLTTTNCNMFLPSTYDAFLNEKVFTMVLTPPKGATNPWTKALQVLKGHKQDDGKTYMKTVPKDQLAAGKLYDDLQKVAESREIMVVVGDDDNYGSAQWVHWGKAPDEVLGLKHGDNTKATITMIGSKKKYSTQIDDWESGHDFMAWAKKVMNGEVKPLYKSQQDQPEREGEVLILTGENFEQKALSAKADVFVKFYAPWCGHCKSLAPTWAEMATKLKDFKNVEVAKFDATENECEEEVTGFPKLVFYPAHKRSMAKKMSFEGARDLDAMVDFLFENALNLEGKTAPTMSVSKKGSYNQVQRELERKKKAKRDTDEL